MALALTTASAGNNCSFIKYGSVVEIDTIRGSGGLENLLLTGLIIQLIKKREPITLVCGDKNTCRTHQYLLFP
jgi:hypothetical protein